MKRGIYKITNPQGKIYIGLSKDIDSRWVCYKNMSSMNNNSLLRESFKTLGYDNHLFEIIELMSSNNMVNERENSKILRERERYWIKYYQSDIIGLNQNKGGSGPNSHTTESKQKISDALKGRSKPISFGGNRVKWQNNKEFKDKISKAKKGKPSPLKGMTRSYKGRISPNKGKGKPILQYSLNNEFIKEHDTGILACYYIGKPKGSGGISDCLRGVSKSAFGFIWKFKQIS